MRVGQVSNEMFGFLCRLEHFDLSGNPGLDQSTLAGYLACTQKNLKDATRIDARGNGMKGEGPAPVLSVSSETKHSFTIARRRAPTFNRSLEGEWLHS